MAKKSAGERLFQRALRRKLAPPKDNGIHGAPMGAPLPHGRRLRIKPTRLPSRMLAGRTMQARLRPASAPPAVTPQAPQQPRPRRVPGNRVVLHERIFPPIPTHGSPASGAPPQKKTGAIEISAEYRAPHTLRTKTGRPCRTDRWFDRMGLCYDSGAPEDSRGGFNDPWLWVGGGGFRCYYPQSTKRDFAAMFSSGSTGRWLNSWSQKSNYIEF